MATPVNNGRSIPETTFDGGLVEVDADRIEQRLNTIWQQTSAGFTPDMPVTKLCLATILIVADAASRDEAELLSREVAVHHPSRVIVMIIDDELNQYTARVQTACMHDQESGAIRCWEAVEVLCDRNKVDQLPGALRALVVGSLPVVSIDLRDYQNTPDFDETVLRLSDFYFVNTDIVPNRPTEQTFLPLRWYRTYPIRYLVGDLVARINARECMVHPVRFELFTSDQHDTYADLLSGWLLHRLKVERPRQQIDTILASYRSFEVRIDIVPLEDIAQTLRITFSDGETGQIRMIGPAGTGSVYQATYRDIVIDRAMQDVPLSRYVVESMRDDSEFDEFIGASQALDRIIRVSEK